MIADALGYNVVNVKSLQTRDRLVHTRMLISVRHGSRLATTVTPVTQ